MILLAVLFSLAGLTPASERTITISSVIGRDRVTFNTSLNTEDELRRWMRLSPHLSEGSLYSSPEFIQLCIKGYPEYKECGTRNSKAENFVYNANVNLNKIRDRIKELDGASYPPALRPVVAYFKNIQENELFFQSHLLEFAREHRTESLTASFGGVYPAQQCSAQIALVQAALDNESAYNLASKEWMNCVSRAFRARAGQYPELVWKKFLQRYSIREEFTEDELN
jgi:hypothetical protein